MTPKAQQAAIAHACGWKNVRPSLRYEVSDSVSDQGRLIGEYDPNYLDFVPDYLKDLNAARDAILQLVVHGCDIIQYRSNEELFQDELDKLVEREQVPVWHFGADLYVEALLRTLNLWDDTK